jgi:transposase
MVFEYDDDIDQLPWPAVDDINATEILEQSRATQQDVLQRELERIEDRLEERNRLYRDVRDDLTTQIKRYRNELQHARSRPFGGNEARREELKDTIEGLSVELRQERRDHWMDRQRLEQERRDVLRQLDRIVEDDVIEDLL